MILFKFGSGKRVEFIWILQGKIKNWIHRMSTRQILGAERGNRASGSIDSFEFKLI